MCLFKVLQSCIRRDFSGVQEYDVEMVHFVLNEEISSIANNDIDDIKKESFHHKRPFNWLLSGGG